MRSFVFAAVGLAALALAFSGARIVAETAAGGQAQPHDHHAAAFDDCAKVCADCQVMCASCASHCAALLAEGKKDHLTTLKTCQDCASLCSAAASIVGRRGPFSDVICTACAEACKRCGDACEKFKDDEHMKKCADECRKCEKACKEMQKQIGAR